MTNNQKNRLVVRLKTVFEQYINWAKVNKPQSLEEMKDVLDDFLDDLSNEDAFGTEGQLDPRGDGRNKTPLI
jgi:hypothetical protein